MDGFFAEDYPVSLADNSCLLGHNGEANPLKNI
jgi:hypothetical protein